MNDNYSFYHEHPKSTPVAWDILKLRFFHLIFLVPRRSSLHDTDTSRVLSWHVLPPSQIVNLTLWATMIILFLIYFRKHWIHPMSSIKLFRVRGMSNGRCVRRSYFSVPVIVVWIRHHDVRERSPCQRSDRATAQPLHSAATVVLAGLCFGSDVVVWRVQTVIP